MKNSYNDDSSDVLPTHMFEWAAATKDIDGSSVARDVVKYDLRDKRAALHESKTSSNRKLEKRLDQLGETIMSRLESEDFDCGFSINENAGSIKVTYDDADDINNRQRNRQALRIVEEVAKKNGARILMAESAAPGFSGTMTIGFAGIGFGATPHVDPNFDPYRSGRGGNKIADLVERLGLDEDEGMEPEGEAGSDGAGGV